MLSRTRIQRSVRAPKSPFRIPSSLSTSSLRTLKTLQKPTEVPKAPTAAEKLNTKPGWLTQKVESSPAAKRVFLAVAKTLGYGSPKQVAGTQAFALYERICAVMPDQDRDFWRNDCALPPTFQSWFTITNLHVWLLTARLRALPPSQATFYQQALLDHFFIDVEDRIRTVLQPPATPTVPYTFATNFYLNPNAPVPGEKGKDGKPKPRSRAPDRIVTRQMKIFKEQWAGMGIAFDLGLAKSDMELAGAIWRNLLGARGATGIAYPSSTPETASAPFKRALNLVGGEVVNVAKIDWEKESTRDDNSGVHDFPPAEVDRYLAYPETMEAIVTYVRRELKRLEGVSDEVILGGQWEQLKFGKIPHRS